MSFWADPFKWLVFWIIARLSRVETPGLPTLTPKEVTPMGTVKLKYTRETPKDATLTATGVYTLDGGAELTVANLTPDPANAANLVGEIDGTEAQAGLAWERNTNKYGKSVDGPKISFKIGDLVPVPETPGLPTVEFADETPEPPPA